MLISYNWLKKYVELSNSTTPEEVGEKLKASTVEIEKVDKQGTGLVGIVVGLIEVADKHPNADKLKVCTVDVGNEKLQIVCGGSNVAAGMKVAVAKLGAKVRWHGEGDLVVMEPAKIRGIESSGMICASTEIGLGEMFPLKEEKEIVDLSSLSAAPGTELSRALGLDDAVLEIDNKSLSHRPDLWGHYGIAREVSALFNRNLKNYELVKIKEAKGERVAVEVKDAKLCPRYMAAKISGVKIAESPEWMKKMLIAVGLRPINNIVDITNFVMLDLGQPMHAFDARQIKNKIIVRPARDQEKFVTLDEKEHTLNSGDVVIADEEKAVALAGVMGGLQSGIADDTTDIIFESANFNPTNIRKTSNRLGLRTDSAVRFEKSLDPNWCEIALKKAVALTLELCPGATVGKVTDVSGFVLPVGPIEMPVNVFRNKLGVIVPDKQIIEILTRLGFEVKNKKSEFLTVKIPTWRATKDVALVEDVVEEVARIFGYDNIPSTLPTFSIVPPEVNKVRRLERAVKNILVKELNYIETYNYSFVSANQVEKLGDNLKDYIELDNPLSKEKPFLRRNLLPNLLENVQKNIEINPELKIFEVGKVFVEGEAGMRTRANSDELLPKQSVWLTAMCVNKKDDTPFWTIRRAVEKIFFGLNLVWKPAAEEKVANWAHSSRAMAIMVGDKKVGVAYELHPEIEQKVGLENRVGILEIDLDDLNEVIEKIQPEAAYEPVSIYPEISRDLAFTVKKEVTNEEVIRILSKLDPLLKKAELFDVYEGKNIDTTKKSVAYHLVYATAERTLTTEEVDKIQEKVVKTLENKLGAEVRK